MKIKHLFCLILLAAAPALTVRAAATGTPDPTQPNPKTTPSGRIPENGNAASKNLNAALKNPKYAPTDTIRPADGQTQEVVLIKTTKGNIRVTLYNDTPRHRDHFLRLVKERYYDGLLFHRVIPNFMVQAGDSASRHAKEGQKLGDSPEPYQIEAEINYPKRFHKCGALAAAREPDDVNPQYASSYSQFYIVTGNICDDERLAAYQEYLDSVTAGRIKLTPEVKETYRFLGGAPYLDGQYTVFGEVIEGLDIVDQIQWAGRDENDRPFDDIRIIGMEAEGPKKLEATDNE